MKNHISSILATILAAVAVSCTDAGTYEFASLYEGLQFDMPRVERPQIPSRNVCITDFGGVGDGLTLNTKAFADAIDNLVSLGGGRITVPEGMWLSGPITLKSGIELHLEKNAVLMFDPDMDLYQIIDTNFEGQDMQRCISPINAYKVKDIAITGEGIIDGNGQAWRELKMFNCPPTVWKARVASGGVLSNKGDVWFPDEGYKLARENSNGFNKPNDDLDKLFIKRFLRPVLVSIRECENVLLEGCTFQNSPAWNLHPLFSKNVIIKDVTVRNPAWSVNGDGLDIDACENVILTGTSFDVGDDAICIKSGKDEDGRRHAVKCRNLLISDCTVYSGHGGFVVGSEMSGGVENIRISDCVFNGTDVGLRFKSTRGRGGVVKDIWIDNIRMKDIINDAVIFNLYYGGKSVSEMKAQGVNAGGVGDIPEVDETTPQFKDIHVSRVICNGAASAIYINGLPEMPVSGMDFTDCIFKAAKGVEINHARDICLTGVKVITPDGEGIIRNDVENLTVK